MSTSSLSFPPYTYSPKNLIASFRKYTTDYSDNDDGGSVVVDLQYNGKKKNNNNYKKTYRTTDDDDNMSIVVAAVQITGSGLPDSDIEGYCLRAEHAISQAATVGATTTAGTGTGRGATADIVLLPELWSGPYFCQSQECQLMDMACPIDANNNNNSKNSNVLVDRMRSMARTYGVVLPVSLFERKNNVLYNSIIVIDSDGTILRDGSVRDDSNDDGMAYRKSHIPDGTGYQEKFYFSPGDTGFRVYEIPSLRNIKIGVAICWDQWFPEVARCMALRGADLLLYPTAIGTEPQDPTIDSSDHWRRVMQGHAAANMIPVVAANRYGTEILLHDDDEEDHVNDVGSNGGRARRCEKQRISFYGKSFITDITGDVVAECMDNDASSSVPSPANNDAKKGGGHCSSNIITAIVNVNQNRRTRLSWGLFRDRRPELYHGLLTKDGR